MLFYIYKYLCNCIRNFFVKITGDSQSLRQFMFIILNWLTLNLKIHKPDEKESDKAYLMYEKEKKFWENVENFFSFYYYMDFILILFLKRFYKKNHNNVVFNLKHKNINNNYVYNYKFKFYDFKHTVLSGISSIWKHLRFWILPLVFVYLYMQYTFFLKTSSVSKFTFGYFLILNTFYLLISGFVFFFKKYQYRLYTSAIQRFWRRTLIIFWLIEASFFVVFMYLTLNASQEPVHVYDNVQMYKTHFYSWRYFLSKIIISTLLIVFTYLLLLTIKWNTFSKANNIVFTITLILFYITWLEFYQFFHLMNCYGIADWFYDFSEHLWNLELEFKRTRIVNHYVTICLIAKFWHIIFSVIFWLFFVLRGLESSRYRYPLLVSNLQNFIIIYIMSWLYMYPWFKYIFRKVLDVPYYWFFVNNRKFGFFLFFNDFKLYYWGFKDCMEVSSVFRFKKTPFYYWYETSITHPENSIGNSQFRKHNIRDFFIKSVR